MQRASTPGLAVGPLQPAFADDARALVLTDLFGTPYSESVLTALEHALLERSTEYQAVAEQVDGNVTGITLFGLIAGTVGTGRILYVAGGSRSLVEAALTQLSARLVIAELPDDRPFDRMRKLLAECGFHEESRIPDLYKTGVALTFLRYVA